MESTIAESSQPQVTIGVDTHKQFHVAHAVDGLGCPRGTYRLPASRRLRRLRCGRARWVSSSRWVSKAPATSGRV